MNKIRQQQIDKILSDIQAIKKDYVNNDCAIRESEIFFESIRSPFKYIQWLFSRAKHIEKRCLLELSDYGKEEWELELQRRLIEMERKRFPGLIKPLVNEVTQYILRKRPAVIMDLGSGGMEAERQVISSLKKPLSIPLIFIGVDNSSISHKFADKNLSTLSPQVQIIKYEKITKSILEQIKSTNNSDIKVVLCKNNLSDLPKDLGTNSVDLLFYSKFRHHLNDEQKKNLDRDTSTIARDVLEFDDFRSWFYLIPPSIMAWKYPVLLNGAIISRLRDDTKKEIIKAKRGRPSFSMGSYLLRLNHKHP